MFRDGRRIPGPPKDSAEAISDCMSRLVSAVAWPKKANEVAYPVMRPACSVLLDGLLQFGAAIESMHPPGEGVAGFQIRGLGQPYRTSRNISFGGPSLEAGQGFPDIETEAGVKRERAIVVRSLHQPHSRGTALVCAENERVGVDPLSKELEKGCKVRM